RPARRRSLHRRPAAGGNQHRRAGPPPRHARRSLHGDCEKAQMRPYLAVLKDSFREALASRVLWIVIFLLTAALLIAAPAGISEEKTARFRRNSVRNWPALVAKIDKQRQTDGPSPGRQIWDRLRKELQEAITGSLAESDELSGDVVFLLVEDLNALLID